MSQFGDYLVQQSAVSEARLEEGLRSQSVYGGRIGTNLLELGYLELDELAAHLTAYHQVPLAEAEWLEEVDPRAVKAVPLSIVRRCKVLPLKLEQDRIHVAMLDPKNSEHLDLVAHAAQRKVIPYILPEIRLLFWLGTHLGIDRHPRYVNLAERAKMAGGRTCETEAPQLDEIFGKPEEDLGGTVDVLEEPEEILLLEELFSEPNQESGGRNLSPGEELESSVPGPSEIASLEVQLEATADRDEIVRLGLRIARGYCDATALFVLRDGKLIGFAASGKGVEDKIRGVELPLESVSIFTQPALLREPFRGAPPHDGIDGRMLECMNRAEAQEVFVQPVEIRERVVNVLYADNGADSLGDTSVAALSALSHCISRAYGRLIVDAKRPSGNAVAADH
jgi:hypothetical protein